MSSSSSFFLFSPLLISLRLMVFVRPISNSGRKAGGTICGFWRASLPVIIFPGVALEEGTAHGCIITSCRLGFPILECVLWGDNSMMDPRKTIVVYSSDNWMKRLAPRNMLSSVLTSFGCRVPAMEGGSSSVLLIPHVRELSETEHKWKMGTFLPQTGNPWPRTMGKWNHRKPSKALVIWANCYEGQWELLKGLNYIKSNNWKRFW